MRPEEIANMVLKGAKEFIKEHGGSIIFIDKEKPVSFRPLVLSQNGILRVVKYHSINGTRIVCLGDGCPVCSRADEIKKLDDTKWYGSNTVGIIQGYSVSYNQEGTAVTGGRFVNIGLRWGGIISFNEFLSGLSESEGIDLFDYSKEVSPVIIAIEEKSTSTRLDTRCKISIPALPADFKEIKDVWISDSTSEADLTTVISFLDNELNSLKAISKTTTTNISSISSIPGAPVQSTSNSSTVPTTPAPAVATSGDAPKCYGAWKLSQECISCQTEANCRVETKRLQGK